MSGTVKQLTVERDQQEFELRTIREQNDECKKQINHMEQALEKVRHYTNEKGFGHPFWVNQRNLEKIHTCHT